MSKERFKANFLWPHETNTIEEAGYEFANAGTEEYQSQWWNVLVARIRQSERNLLRDTNEKLSEAEAAALNEALEGK